jgi:acyl-CoA reductase-like NAD-dependent aldehyde dehydrogenase
MVEEAIAAGAEVIVRGGTINEGPLACGAFYRPTLLEVRDTSMAIVQQEEFSPVLAMQRFDTEAEAIELADATEFGLCASVWSRDVDRPLRVAHAIQHRVDQRLGRPARPVRGRRFQTKRTGPHARRGGS